MTDQIDLNDIELRHDTPSPITGEGEQSSQTQTGFLYTLKGKIILFSIIGIVVVGAIIGVAIALIKPCKGCECDNSCPVPCEGCECDNSSNTIICHKVNEILVYDDVQTKTTSVELNTQSRSSRRRLDENTNFSQETKMTSKYIINVYKEENEIYYAYAAIINMDKKIEERDTETLGGVDITKENNVNNKIPAAKFTFNGNGEILSFKVAEEIDKTLAAYLYELVQKAIPNVTGNLNEVNDSEYELIETKDEGNWKSHIKNGKVHNIEEKSNSILHSDSELMDLNINNNNFTEEVQYDENALRQSLIKTISTEVNSEVILSEEKIDEETTNFIKSLLEEVNFVDYEPSRRRLEIIPNKISRLEQLRELETVEIEPYAMPVFFTYPLFRSNLLGDKIGLSATVSFYPITGQFTSQMSFYHGGKEEILFEKKTSSNFKEIIDNIFEITQNVYLIIKTKIENNILTLYSKSKSEIETQLEGLFKYLKDYIKIPDIFESELTEILTMVNRTTANCYNAAWERTYWTTNHFEELKNSLSNKEDDYINSIVSETEASISNFITKNKEQINTLYDNWNTFYTSTLEDLIDIKTQIDENHLGVDTGVYYNIKDQMTKLLNIFTNFRSNLEDAITIEKKKYDLYVDEQFDEIVDPSLRRAEVIAEYATNNASVIDGMYIYWSTDFKRERMINQINAFRSTLDTIKTLILNRLTELYNSKTTDSTFSSLLSDVQSKLTTISEQYNTLLKKLREINKYDINFDIYFEDMKLLDTLEKEVNEIRKSSYNTYFVDYLNGIERDFLSDSELNNITNTINDYFIELKKKIINGDFSGAVAYSLQFSNIVVNINDKYLGNNLLNRINQTYSSKIDEMLTNYYSVVNPVFEKFNTSFFDINYKEHKDQYKVKPTELSQKLLNISYALAPQNSHFFENIQNLLFNQIYYGLYDSNILVINIIASQYNDFIKFATKYNNNNMNVIKTNLAEYTKKYFDNDGRLVPVTLYPLTKEDEFNMKNKILSYENKIRNNLLRITDQINIDFKNYFCYGNTLVCFTEDIQSSIDHYYYQASKLRTALSFIESLISIAQSMISKDILSNLSSDEFRNIFKNELTYRTYDILTQIMNYLGELNENTKLFIKNSIEDLESDMISAFISGINVEGIAKKIDLIVNETYTHSKTLSKEIVDYLYYACGPISKLEVAFNEEIIFREIISNKKYIFVSESYEKSYKNVVEQFNTTYYEKRNTTLDELEVPDVIIKKLKQHIKDFIENSYEQILENINSLSDITEFEFLNMTYSLRDISVNVLTKEKETLIENVNANVELYFMERLNDTFKNAVLENIDKQYLKIFEALDYEYNATYTRYKNNQNANGYDPSNPDSYVKELSEVTIEEINSVLELFFEKIIQTYSNKNVNEIFEEQYYSSIISYPFEANFENFTSLLLEDINIITELSYKRHLQEKREFQSNIRGFFIDAFNRTAISFINGKGKTYLDNIINSDYEYNIYYDFNLMKTTVIDTSEYISMLLDTAELKGIGYTLASSFVNIFPDVSEEINTTIPNKIENIIYPKIETFNNEVKTKIVNLFVNTLKKDNNLLVDFLNNKIYSLVPKTFSDSFNGELEANFDDIISNSITLIKNNYKTSIQSDLQTVVNTLTEYGNKVTESVSKTTFTKLAQEWIILNRLSNNLTNDISNFDKTFMFELTDNKKQNIKNFYKYRIYDYIHYIKDDFDYQVNIGQTQLDEYLETFNVENKVTTVKELLESKSFISNILTVRSNLESIFTNLVQDVVNEFDKFNETLKTECEANTIKGFNKERRNLGESYSLSEIEYAFKEIEEKYNEFKKDVTRSNSFSSISSHKRGFITSLTNSASSLTNNFYAYEVLIAQYTNVEKLNKYFNYLEDQASTIREDIKEYMNTHTSLLDNTVQSIYNKFSLSYNEIKGEVIEIINKALDDVFTDKFEKLNNISDYLAVNPNLDFSIATIIYYNSKEEIVKTVDVKINGLVANYGYSLKKLNDYDFIMDVNTDGVLNLTAIVYINNFFKETITGALSNVKVGVETNYILHDRSTEIDAYVKPAKTSYEHVIEKEINFGIWETISNFTIFPPDRELHMTKTYKRRIW